MKSGILHQFHLLCIAIKRLGAPIFISSTAQFHCISYCPSHRHFCCCSLLYCFLDGHQSASNSEVSHHLPFTVFTTVGCHREPHSTYMHACLFHRSVPPGILPPIQSSFTSPLSLTVKFATATQCLSLLAALCFLLDMCISSECQQKHSSV
jgi:hypothetical protein